MREIRTSNLDRYYGSDLNKYIHDNCTEKMTVINGDCIQLKRINGKTYIRFIESKYKWEDIGVMQMLILCEIAKAFRAYAELMPDIITGVYLVKGNAPDYDNVVIHKIGEDGKNIKMDKAQFLKWLNFEKE